MTKLRWWRKLTHRTWTIALYVDGERFITGLPIDTFWNERQATWFADQLTENQRKLGRTHLTYKAVPL